MIPKYTVEYGVGNKQHARSAHYSTDDPVACEEFLCELLDRGCRILDIMHEGLPLERAGFDRLVKNAAAMLASKHLCASLAITAEEQHFRFGFAA